MAFDSTTKRHMDRARFGLVAATVLLGAWACARVVGYFNGPAHAGDRVAQAMARGAPDANEVKPAREAAEALKKKNLFSKEPPKEHPVKQIDGILGAEVLIGDKLYKVGQKVGDATIIAIEPTQVTVEWNGQKKTFSPFETNGDRPSGPPGPPEAVRARMRESRPPRPEVKAEAVQVTAAPTTADDDPLAWMGVKVPDALRGKFLEKWNSLSDEEKAEAKEQWNSMPAEQKQQAVQAMERGDM
jgi:hypothetical protein